MTMLADFHMHSTHSDGSLTIRQIVDLHGRLGFGAISITDHLCEQATFLGAAAKYLNKTLTPEHFKRYLEEIKEEADRAWDLYKMIVIPGIEITKNTFSNHRSAHLLILGLNEYIDPDLPIEKICDQALNQGALTVAAHPVWTRKLEKQTFHLWDRLSDLRKKIDLWEVASGSILFTEVQEAKLKMLANSDMHTPLQISSWKNILNCERKQEAVLESIAKGEIDYKFVEISDNNIIFDHIRNSYSRTESSIKTIAAKSVSS